MSTLKELLEAKKKEAKKEEEIFELVSSTSLSSFSSLSSPTSLSSIEKEDFVNGMTGNSSYEPRIPSSNPLLSSFPYFGYTEPDFLLFVNIHRPFLIDPYSFNVTNFRIYEKWLLGSSLYVLNTFSKFETSNLINILLEKKPPVNSSELYSLTAFIGEIELTVPGKYMEEFERVASK